MVGAGARPIYAGVHFEERLHLALELVGILNKRREQGYSTPPEVATILDKIDAFDALDGIDR